MARHHIYLVPGFFGFANLGGITYFHHVREILEKGFQSRGKDVVVVAIDTLPTGSIRQRATRLVEQIAETAGEKGPIHLIGHSTGGIDVRMAATPNVSLSANLSPTINVESLARRIRSVVTVATPHMGTPMAALFSGLVGQKLLQALTLGTIYTLRFGRMPLRAIFELIGVVTRLDRRFGLEGSILEQFYRELFADFGKERGAEISDYLNLIRNDRQVIVQLTPGSIDLINATTSDRKTARYGCVVTRAPGLSLKVAASLKFDIYSHASHSMFRLLQTITSLNSHYYDIRTEQESKLLAEYGEVPSCRSNDGVVPTLSQIRGEIIHVATADHLDVCGHFRDPKHDPPHVDWFVSGSRFRRPEFDSLWNDVTQFMLDK